jgi:iron complex transport system permease protein
MGSSAAKPRNFGKALTGSIAVFLTALLLSPLVGPTHLNFSNVIAGQAPDFQVMVALRIPRVLLGMLAGGCLALAGAVFQTLLRDALATPYTLGVSSGASLGAVVSICFLSGQMTNLPVIWLGSITGAALVLILVLGIAGTGERMSSFTLLLAGIAVSSMCMALIDFVHSVAGFTQSFSITRWLLGGIDAVAYRTLAWLTVVVLPAVAVVLARGPAWNLLAVGEEWAAARGVAVDRLLFTGYIAASVLTAPVTAVTGPIGFVGLIVPHALRLWIGADHRLLMPCSFLCGAAFLAICDAVGRVALAPADLPAGVITALLGGPFFIWLLRARKRSIRA